jgi:Fe2+ or Zn2+ uptake regulation protein
MNKEELFRQRLSESGERISSARLAIYRTLARTSPVSTTKLVTRMKAQAIDPATTYRTLKLLRQMGLLRDLVTGGRRLIELTDDHSVHHHFWCQSCGSLIDFSSPELEELVRKTAKRLSVLPKTHQLEVTGICSSCI